MFTAISLAPSVAVRGQYRLLRNPLFRSVRVLLPSPYASTLDTSQSVQFRAECRRESEVCAPTQAQPAQPHSIRPRPAFLGDRHRVPSISGLCVEDVSLHSLLRSRIFAAWAMQCLARPAGMSKGSFSEFCCVLPPLSRRFLAQTQFLRYRFALLTFPPIVTRFRLCIGCDHAAYQRKEKHHEQQTFTSRLRSQRLLVRSRGRLAAQERQGLRHRDPRRHQREWTHRLHGAQARRSQVSNGRPLGLRPRRAVLRNRAGYSVGCSAFSFLPPCYFETWNAVRPAFRAVVSRLNRSARETQSPIAAFLILGFSHSMIRASIADSKLSLVTPAHATANGLSARAVAPTWQGRGEPLPLHPSPMPLAAATETVPVSEPSAEVRP